ncbi:MAG: DUF4923 family protein [Bacteroidales bacterium]|nr:DUF4923 family protein [Bacteroidales bacterium]
MKKVIAVIGSMMLVASVASAQSWLDSFLKIATEKVGDVLTGKSSGTAFDIKGSWKYQGVAIGASSDNALASIAASAGSGTVENKLNELLAKAGIKAGAATFNFKDDGSFTLLTGKINIPGTWTKEGDKLTLNFAKVITFKLVGTIKTTTEGCQILFDTGKFLDFVKKVLDAVGKLAGSNATLSTVQQALANVNELKLGFKLSK